MSEHAERIIDIGDRTKRGMYRDFDSEVPWYPSLIVNNDSIPNKYRLVRRSRSGERPWDDVNIEGAAIEFALGNADQPPSSGSWSMTYSGTGTSLTSIGHNESAVSFQTRLNANPAIGADGGVTVSKVGTAYTIVFNTVGAKGAFTANVTGLIPECVGNPVSVVQQGSTTARHIVVIRLVQRPAAYRSTWTKYAPGSVTVSQRQAGSVSKRAIQRIKFGVEAYEGTLGINWPIPEIVDVSMKANAGVKAVYKINCQSDSGSNLAGTYIDLHNGISWYRYMLVSWNGSVSNPDPMPSAPAGYVLNPVTYEENADAGAVATALNGIMGGAFAVSVDGSIITVTQMYGGTRPVPVNTTTATVTITTQGAPGEMGGKGFQLVDQHGTVGVWFNDMDSNTIPPIAASARRSLAVPILGTDTAASIAVKTAAVLEADPEFTAAVVNTSVVRATDAFGGSRQNAAEIAGAGVTLSRVQVGAAVSGVVPFNAKPAALEKILKPHWEVKRRGEFDFELVATSTGVRPLVEVDSTGLIFANAITGSLACNTYQMFLAFAATDAPIITMTLQGRIAFPGEAPFTFFFDQVSVHRSIIVGEDLVPLARPLGFWTAPPHTLTSPAQEAGMMAGNMTGLWYSFGVNQWGFIPQLELSIGGAGPEDYGKVPTYGVEGELRGDGVSLWPYGGRKAINVVSSDSSGTGVIADFRYDAGSQQGLQLLRNGTMIWPEAGRAATRANLGGFIAIAVGTGGSISVPSGGNVTVSNLVDSYDPTGAHSGGIITVPRTGVYGVTIVISVATIAAGQSWLADLWVNGAFARNLGRSATQILSGSVFIRLNAGDNVRVNVSQSSGVSANLTTHFSSSFSVVEQVTQ